MFHQLTISSQYLGNIYVIAPIIPFLMLNNIIVALKNQATNKNKNDLTYPCPCISG